MSAQNSIAARFDLGVEIYYTGDMANSSGYGVVIAVRPPDKWSSLPTIDVLLEDERVIHSIRASNFEGPGHRFEFADDHRAERRRRAEEFERYCAERGIGVRP